MPNIQSAKKRLRKSRTQRYRNRIIVSRIKTFIKKVHISIELQKSDEASLQFKQAMSYIHKGVTKGVMKKNTASRFISRLNAKVKALS